MRFCLPEPQKRTGRPFTYINAAISADGKLAPDDRVFLPFTSRFDHELLHLLRTRADAVLSGARTVSSGSVTMDSGGESFELARLKAGRRPVLLKVIASGRAQLDPALPVFQNPSPRVLLLTTQAAKPADLARLRPVLGDIHVSLGNAIDWVAAMRWLAEKHSLGSLVCEGGGEVNGAMIRSGLVDELYLTLAPVLFGGRDSPTLADGTSPRCLFEAASFKLKRAVRRGAEMYLSYVTVQDSSSPTSPG